MNRVFKRSSKGDSSHKEIKFTFEGKLYPAYLGDTIEAALLANNILNAGRTKSGTYACSAANLYQGIVDIIGEDQRFTIVSRDFLVTDGLKLGQTNKRKLKDHITSTMRFLKSRKLIPEVLDAISAHDITRAVIRIDSVKDMAVQLLRNMALSVEKSFIHSDIVIIGMSNQALQTAYIMAEAGCYVILCDNGLEDAYQTSRNSELLSIVSSHKLIKIKKISDIRICQDTNRVIATERAYMFSSQEQESILKLYVINARYILLFPNLQELGFLFAGHHLPAIMGIREYMGLHHNFGLTAEKNIVLYVSNDQAYDILSLPHISSKSVEVIIDTRSQMTEAMMKAEKSGIKLYAGYVIAQAHGTHSVENITIQSVKNTQEDFVKSIKCDLLLHSLGYVTDLLPLGKHINIDDKMSVLPEIVSENIFVIDAQSNTQKICEDILNTFGQEIKIPKDFWDQYASSSSSLQGINDIDIPSPSNHTLFPQDMPFGDFIQVIHQYDNPLEVIDTIKQYSNFYNNHAAIHTLLKHMQEVYNYEAKKISEFYKKVLSITEEKSGLPATNLLLDNIPVCGYPKPHILTQIETEDYNSSDQSLKEYYDKIKHHAGIRLLDQRIIIDISGIEVCAFLNHILSLKDFNNITIGQHIVLTESNCQNPTIIMCLQKNKFFLLADKGSDIVKAINEFNNKNQFKVVVNSVHQNWALIQLVGQEATMIFENVTRSTSSALVGKAGYLWLENIQLIFAHYEHYDITHIDILITSDAANYFYQSLINSDYNLYPFAAPIYDIIMLEAGHIFNVPQISQNRVKSYEEFTTQALAVPLVKSDIPLCAGYIFSEKHHAGQDPQGVLLSKKIFSPYYGQYVLPVLLKGTFDKWNNKTVSVMSEDKVVSMQVKIISDKMLKIDEVA